MNAFFIFSNKNFKNHLSKLRISEMFHFLLTQSVDTDKSRTGIPRYTRSHFTRFRYSAI